MKWALAIVALFATSELSISGAVTVDKVNAALNQMQSADSDSRMQGFYNLVQAGLATDKDSEFPVSDGILTIARTSTALRTEVVSALNSLLEKETSFGESGAAPRTEEFSNYYGDLIHAVTTLRDASSTNVLLKSINTGGMAQDALAGFGDDALTGSLEMLQSGDEETRHSIYRMLTSMSETRNINRFRKPESRALLSSALVSGANEKNPWTRAIVARGLANLGTPEAAQALTKLAEADPFTKSDKQQTRYPVREAASKALQNLKSRSLPPSGNPQE